MSFEEMKNTLIHNCIGMYLVMSIVQHSLLWKSKEAIHDGYNWHPFHCTCKRTESTAVKKIKENLFVCEADLYILMLYVSQLVSTQVLKH